MISGITYRQKVFLIVGTAIVIFGSIFTYRLKTAESSNKVLPIVYKMATPTPSLTATPTVTLKYKPVVSKVLSPTLTEKPIQTTTSTSTNNNSPNNSNSQNNPQPTMIQSTAIPQTAAPTIIIPTPTTYQITPTATPTPMFTQSSEGVSVDKTSVTANFSRTNADNGLIYGSGFTITSHGATGFLVWQNSQGVGFYEASGGLTSNSTQTIRTYINPNKPNGTYTGSAIVKYTDSNNTEHDGSTVNYSITLSD